MTKVILVFLSLSLFVPFNNYGQSTSDIDYNQVSQDLLQAIKDGSDTKEYRDVIESSSIEDLEKGLQSNDQKLAFWINIYNSYIIMTLQDSPELYEDRKTFFKEDRILVGGELVSFAKIEHGVIRRSQWDLGLGLIRKPFPGGWERKLRVDKKDYRIHFALNCGAKACPPVTIYDPENLEKQFAYMTEKYLSENTEYNKEENKVTTTPLFSWFRGDFGCKKGVKKILASHGLVPSKKVNLNFKGYDWTLDIDNFVEIPQ